MKAFAILLIACLAALVSADFKDGGYILTDPCTTDAECTTRCGDAAEYLKQGVLSDDEKSQVDWFAHWLTGKCGWAGTDRCGCYIKDDGTCSQANSCKPDKNGCVPVAFKSQDPKFLCECKKECPPGSNSGQGTTGTGTGTQGTTEDTTKDTTEDTTGGDGSVEQ
ncbi:hypothetical protein HDK90DRAFT_553043 [Phyllosticta capitalensis]|uniref:Uncharacterized protein n=1 Tax=Phyllosticta capitalensis TaxID=121624 RepID=A0ABR1YLH0_9PEZI